MGEQVGGVETVSSRVQVRPTRAVAAWDPKKDLRHRRFILGGTEFRGWKELGAPHPL